jgi:hypothetical protein
MFSFEFIKRVHIKYNYVKSKSLLSCDELLSFYDNLTDGDAFKKYY